MNRVFPNRKPCSGDTIAGKWPSSSFSVAIHNPTAQSAAKKLVYNMPFNNANTGATYAGKLIQMYAQAKLNFNFLIFAPL